MSELIDYLNNDKSAYHAVRYCENVLKNNGFTELNMDEKFELLPLGKYYVKPNLTSLFAFTMPDNIETILPSFSKIDGMRILMAHTDFPTFKIKPVADLSDKAGVNLINVEPYGGSLKKTWFDRPLGIAGVVYLSSEDCYEPKAVLFDSEEAWVTIPSLAPHMDREIEKKDIDPAKEMNPVLALSLEGKSLITMIAEKLGVEEDNILSYDLSLYDVTKALYIGANKEFIQAGKIDNMASCMALVESILVSNKLPKNHIPMIALFDNEEIGSRTRQGADSNLLKWIIDKILLDSKIAENESDIISILTKSFLVSCDGAHAVHPNYPEKADTSSTAIMGKGVVIKTSASQRYVTDPKAMAIIKALCKKGEVSYQLQANKSGTPGGQTLGPIASSYIPTLAIDIGVPMLAMHSIREMICEKDFEQFCVLVALIICGIK